MLDILFQYVNEKLLNQKLLNQKLLSKWFMNGHYSLIGLRNGT